MTNSQDYEEIEHDGATDMSIKQNLINSLNPQMKVAENSQVCAGENASNNASDEQRHCTEQVSDFVVLYVQEVVTHFI